MQGDRISTAHGGWSATPPCSGLRWPYLLTPYSTGASMLEHGGNLRSAAQRFGQHEWLDLSTGINPHWYPAPAIAANAWHRLPEPSAQLAQAAASFYVAPLMLPVAGTQAAIQALPRLRAPSR